MKKPRAPKDYFGREPSVIVEEHYYGPPPRFYRPYYYPPPPPPAIGLGFSYQKR